MTTNDAINLFDVGSLLNLRITKWSGRKMLSRSDFQKLGYDPDNLPKELVNFGRKLLVPSSEILAIGRIEQRARKALDRWSVPFGMANAHFVPAKMLPTIEQQMEGFRAEFFGLVDSFITRFPQMIDKVKEDFPDFWEKCLKNHYPANPQTLREYFRFEWYTFRVSGISGVEAASVDEIVASQQERDKRNAMIREKMQKEVSGFVNEYVGTMRAETVRFCDLMTARVNGQPFEDEDKPKTITPKSLACFRDHVERFREMNIFGDKEIEELLTSFRDNYLDSGVNPAFFQSAGVKSSVTKALGAIRTKATGEGGNNGFFGDLQRKVVI